MSFNGRYANKATFVKADDLSSYDVCSVVNTPNREHHQDGYLL